LGVTPSAKNLVMNLLLAASSGAAVPVREMLRASAVFDLREASVRVAIVRLASAGLIESAGRGAYRLGEKAQSVAREVGAWRTVEKKVRAWDGAWLALHLGGVERSDRAAARQRSRALQIVGFRELEQGLAVRPDNLEGSVERARSRLEAFGVEAPVFRASSFDARTEARLRRLWDGKALTASYVRGRLRLERWLDRADSLEPKVAAREVFVLGAEAIRQIVRDPLLPAPLTDPDERRAFVDAMRSFDRVGRGIWLGLIGVKLGSPDSVQDAWVH
jgi:phenylacetic acid degradation operon negative regulatory protein